MTLTVQIKVPSSAGQHEAEIKCSTDGYKHATVLAPGDELTVHVHAANEVHIAEVPAGTKAARIPVAATPAIPPHQQRVLDEKQELDIRITRLDEFILRNALFRQLDPEEQARLRRQLDVMRELSVILGERISAF